MTTSNKYLSLTEKRILGWQSFKDNLFDYWSGWVQDLQKRVFSRSGTFLLTNLVGAGADHFSLVDYLEDEVAALDGEGNLLSPDARPTDVADVVFENALGVTYHVGIQRADIPSGLHVNPVDGMPFFDSFEEIIGVAGTPNAVVDNGTTLTFTVNGITQSGVSFAGRKVKVWKIGPGKEALTESVGLEECTVAFTTPNNKITTVGNFGQGTSPSTTAAHYVVVLIGPKVSTISLVADPVACYIGNILGVGIGSEPTVLDMSEQYVIENFLNQLSEVVRTEPSNGRLKIDVKALGTESGIDQIRVTKVGSGIKFQVDEDGNVEIQGDLVVQGTETIYNTEIVYADETITGNLTAGDAAADSHKIKGTWWHTNVAETACYFKVDGTTGEIGIGAEPETGYVLHTQGTVWLEGSVYVGVAAPRINLDDVDAATNQRNFTLDLDAGVLSCSSWNDAMTLQDTWLTVTKKTGSQKVNDVEIKSLYDANSEIHFQTGFIRHTGISVFEDVLQPNTTNLRDIGTDALRFKNAYFEGTVFGNVTAFLADGTNPALALKRTADATADRRYWEIATLADGTLDFRGRNASLTMGYTWLKVIKRNTVGSYHQANQIEMNAVGSIDLTSTSVNVVGDFSVSSNVISNLVPTGTRNLGASPSNYWNVIYGTTINGTTVNAKVLNVDDSTPGTYGISTSLFPTVNSSKNLGHASYRFLQTHTDELKVWDGLIATLRSKTDMNVDLGDSTHRFQNSYTGVLYVHGPSLGDNGRIFLGTETSNQKWRIDAGPTFSIWTKDNSWLNGYEAIKIERSLTVPTTMTIRPKIVPYADLTVDIGDDATGKWEAIYAGAIRLHRVTSGNATIDLRDEQASADHESWRITNSMGTLRFSLPSDDFSSVGKNVLTFTRNALGDELSEIVLGDSVALSVTTIRPSVNYQANLGADLYRWGYIYTAQLNANGLVTASQVRCTQPPTSVAGTLTVGYEPTALTSGAVAKLGPANGQIQTGWLAFYLGLTKIYVPYWTTII